MQMATPTPGLEFVAAPVGTPGSGPAAPAPPPEMAHFEAGPEFLRQALATAPSSDSYLNHLLGLDETVPRGSTELLRDPEIDAYDLWAQDPALPPVDGRQRPAPAVRAQRPPILCMLLLHASAGVAVRAQERVRGHARIPHPVAARPAPVAPWRRIHSVT